MVRSCVLHYYRMTRTRTSCAAVKAKGCPLPYVWALLDGTFRDLCRPCKDGYEGLAQRVQYSGAKKTHGNNHQGLETPDGMIIEMHGPFEYPYTTTSACTGSPG